MICGNCGKQLPDNATLCTSCGWKTETWTQAVKKTRNQSKSTVVGLSVIGVILVAVLLIFCVLITQTI